MLLLKVERPKLLHFPPGQYVYLTRVPDVDGPWHPFSIGLGSESNTWDFYIKVYDDKSWSGRMFKIIPQHREEDERRTESSVSAITGDDQPEHYTLKVEVLGPYVLIWETR